jgi:hypothetical protein
MSFKDKFSVPTINLTKMGFKNGAKNLLVFDSRQETEDGSNIYVSISVEPFNNFVCFSEIFVNIGVRRESGSDRSIKCVVLAGGRLRLLPSFCYSHLSPDDQNKVDSIVLKIQKSLKRWNGSEYDEPGEMAIAVGV